MSYVSLVKKMTNESIYTTIEKSLELINFDYKKNIHDIVIKPNMCYYWDYTTGKTTDPFLIEEIIKLLRVKYSSDINISIVESDASAMRCKYAFKMLGYEKICNRNKVNLINLSEVEGEKQKVYINNNSYEFDVPLVIKNTDLFINVPKMKYMDNIKITCSLKNVFGCNPYNKKFIYHNKLEEIIVAINKLIKTDLCIVDGLIVFGEKNKKIDLVMASIDPVALDTVAAKIIGINPSKVEYIKLAEKEKLGTMNYITKGENFDYFKDIFPGKTLESNIISFGYQIIKIMGLNKRMGL
jgi:uncharacterized protein (DUF362 family)